MLTKQDLALVIVSLAVSHEDKSRFEMSSEYYLLPLLYLP
jgi:hypothetical protein